MSKVKAKKKYKSNNIRGKLRVHRLIAKDKSLKRLLPSARAFTKKNLNDFSTKYRTIYIKPDIGSLGIGVKRLKPIDKGFQLDSVGNKKQYRKTFTSTKKVYDHIRATTKRKLLIQKGVSLAKVDGKPYDIRAMVQRKPKGAWVCTGFLVKVGAKGKIVTNYHQGGKIITLPKLLQQLGYSKEKREATTHFLKKQAVKVAKHLSAHRSGMHEMGIDFAYDNSGKLWILEVNSNHPQFHPLRTIDRTAFNRMMTYAKSYGRRTAK